jgi:CRP/FNR family transcriptional regulator, cyclic AMP receptor protein
MGFVIRQLNGNDAADWQELLIASIGKDYPDKQVYELAWCAAQLEPVTGHETWALEANGHLQASVSFLQPASQTKNPVLNLGRQLFHPESFKDGSAEALLRRINKLGAERRQMIVARVLASDRPQQVLHEKIGYVCAGFQPFKHLFRLRQGALFYVWFAKPDMVPRLPISVSLSHVSELAVAVLDHLRIPNPLSVRDGATGYPLQTELQIHEASYNDFALWRLHAQSSSPPTEISSGYNLGLGLLRTSGDSHVRAFLGKHHQNVVAGLAYLADDRDRCVRLVDSFSTDDVSMGTLFNHAVKIAQDQLNAVYLEADILMTAPRLLKTAEQLGFVPVAYLPAFYFNADGHTDVVKVVKLNLAYSIENTELTVHAKATVRIVDQNFEDQRIGVAIINLLRGLPVFEGLGDGELRKIARLFHQKLFRPGERIFNKGDAGNEAYVVMRGQIEIYLEEKSLPIATVGGGQIFGELAFLDGAPRIAFAIANQASILLMIHRAAFNELVQREPHLGMMVMRNIALEVTNRLRRTNLAVVAVKE